jgi:hypothetical protein
MAARNSIPSKSKSLGVPLDDLAYYFDAVDRDRLEASGTSRKAGEVLALRERLLKLPDGQFEAAIKTLHALVDGAGTRAGDEGADERTVRRNAARTLYSQVASKAQGGSGSSTGKVSPT